MTALAISSQRALFGVLIWENLIKALSKEEGGKYSVETCNALNYLPSDINRGQVSRRKREGCTQGWIAGRR